MIKKNMIIVGVGVGVGVILLTITYLNKNDLTPNNKTGVASYSQDTSMETNTTLLNKGADNILNKKTLESLNSDLNSNDHMDNDKSAVMTEDEFSPLALSLASSDPEEIDRALEILSHQMMLDSGFSKEAARKITSGDPNDSLLSIDSLPEELQSSIKKELENSKKNGYDKVSDQYSEGIINITNHIVDTSPMIPNIRFTLSKIPDIIAFNYNYIGYSFPNTSVLGKSPSLGTQGTTRRVYQKLDESQILIIEESSLQSGSANSIREFVNAQIFGYPAIYAIKKTSSEKKYAMLSWTTKDFAYTLYQINSLDNAQSLLTSVGNSLTELNVKENTQTDEKNTLPVESRPKSNVPF
ncbi:MAG: hypothetical protein L3J00_05150 [Thiomicrorhabdus sp.]|nr:hypothetical protein [Thiomicrorhabdus sp.]